MLFEVIPPVAANVTADPDWIVPFAQAAERFGFDGIVAPEHVAWVANPGTAMEHDGQATVTGPTTMFPDPLELLAFLAAHTSTLTLATGVIVLPEHHPVVLAKRIATLDALSGGRVRLGFGVGWNRDEMELCGQDFETRGARASEAIDVLRTLWSGSTDEGQSYTGTHYTFENVYCNPKPLRGDVPIHVGGSSPAAARRAGRLGDGFQPLNLEGQDLADRLEIVHEAAREAGRDPGVVELTLRRPMAQVTRESIVQDRLAGANRLVVNGTTTPDLPRAVRELEEFARLLSL